MGARGPLARTAKQAWEYLLNIAQRTEKGCLLVTEGHSVGIGYKRIRADGAEWYMHQLSDFIHRGPASYGTVIRHSCDRPNCIEITHLLRGTHADNVQDKMSRDRQPVGERKAESVLSNEQAMEILNSELNYAELSRMYGISRGGIHNIKSGRTWNSVTGLPKKR